MNKTLIGGLVALSLVGVVSAIAVPAFAQGPDYRTWRDSQDIRTDMRAVHGEDHRIAMDRANLRRDYYHGNYAAARADQHILHRDLRNRSLDKSELHHDQRDRSYDWNH